MATAQEQETLKAKYDEVVWRAFYYRYRNSINILDNLDFETLDIRLENLKDTIERKGLFCIIPPKPDVIPFKAAGEPLNSPRRAVSRSSHRLPSSEDYEADSSRFG